MDDLIEFDDNCLYVIWYDLWSEKHINKVVQKQLEKSPKDLKRDDFFLFLWENHEFDNIFKFLTKSIQEKLDFNMMKFRSDMSNWVSNHLVELVP